MNMESKELNETICRNFFAALERLTADKVIRGKATFAKRYGINRMNFYQLQQDMSRQIFQPSWLYNLVADYKVNPMFLITGEGSFYLPKWTAQRVKKLQMNCKKESPTSQPIETQSDAK